MKGAVKYCHMRGTRVVSVFRLAVHTFVLANRNTLLLPFHKLRYLTMISKQDETQLGQGQYKLELAELCRISKSLVEYVQHPVCFVDVQLS